MTKVCAAHNCNCFIIAWQQPTKLLGSQLTAEKLNGQTVGHKGSGQVYVYCILHQS